MSDVEYTVKTNLPPEMVSRVALEIFNLWVAFAMGQGSLGGKRLVYPTGRYASSIQYRQEGVATVAILADESIAPEAGILEKGHPAIDLKTKLAAGRYPMHRAQGATKGTSLRRVGGGPPSRNASMWADIRAGESSGFATIGPNSPPGSWIIPPMPAYSPAMILAARAQKIADAL